MIFASTHIHITKEERARFVPITKNPDLLASFLQFGFGFLLKQIRMLTLFPCSPWPGCHDNGLYQRHFTPEIRLYTLYTLHTVYTILHISYQATVTYGIAYGTGGTTYDRPYAGLYSTTL
jgi:hypothetical protein